MATDIHKTVIVTGASQGIGAGLVKAFLDRRYNVVATSRSITKRGGFKASDKLELVDGSITCAVLFYLSRLWSYLYFVPQIFDFMKMQADTALSPEIAGKII